MLYQTIHTLIEFNANPFATNASGESALYKASVNIDLDILQLMCNDSAKTFEDDNDIDTEKGKNITALMAAIQSFGLPWETERELPQNTRKDVILSAVILLLQVKSNPNAQFQNGDSVFMQSVKTSYPDLVKALLENSLIPIDHNYQNKKGETALSIACEFNQTEILNIYLNHLKTFEESKLFNVNIFDDTCFSPLSYACKNGNFEAVKMLLGLGANPNLWKIQSIPLIESIKSGHFELVKFLLENNAGVNQSDLDGNSPLHHAILSEKYRLVDLLLSFSADYRAVNRKGQTPLHLTIEVTKKQTNRSFRIERSLLTIGADINAMDCYGRTPLHYIFTDSNMIPLTRKSLVISKKVKQILKEIQSQKEIDQSLDNYISGLHLDDFHTEGIEHFNTWMKNMKMNQINQEFKSRKAWKNNKEEMFDISSEERATLSKYLACTWESEVDIPQRSDPIDILKYLSNSKGLIYDLADEFGRTPLHYAACVGAFSCTTFLIENKIDINALDLDNNGGLQLALRNNYVDYSVMLCNFGAKIDAQITLKTGKSVPFLEFIKDGLQNGKFHLVEVLLFSANSRALSETLVDQNQNIWHIIANFNPFDREIWKDYLDNFIPKLASAHLEIYADKYGRTPLHYAAKHGQYTLLEYLLQIHSIVFDIYDEEEISLCF
ncbi:MAG: ankyrin repeat-containing domain protein [Benjaminiella poitrasii]|nr:MAG: ankyrin repeat-containing domain protein [Benjaminiella poitrasii]